MDFDAMYKVIIIGDPAVGKSNILLRYNKNQFNREENPTIGADFYSHFVDVDGQRIKLQIWDTAGQEHFRSIVKSYYKGIHGAMVVYDVTNKDSFNHVSRWLEEIDTNTNSASLPVVLAGNKKDLAEQREVTVEEAQEYAAENELFFMETSAKDNADKMIEAIFLRLCADIAKSVKAQQAE